MKTKILISAILTSVVMTAAAAQNAPARPDFSVLDADGDGGVTLAEIEAQAASRFATSDANGDGGLSAEELIAASNGRAADRVTQMMERFDANGDGLLQQSEMPQRGGDRAAKMFERVDADSDGIITQAEFDAVQGRMGDRDRQGDRG